MTTWNRPPSQRGDHPTPEPFTTLIEFMDGSIYVVRDPQDNPPAFRPIGSVIAGLDDSVRVHWEIRDDNGDRIGSASVQWPMHRIKSIKHCDAGWTQWGPRD